jgi:hypothetical protein
MFLKPFLTMKAIKLFYLYYQKFFFFWWDWGLNLGLRDCKAGTLHKKCVFIKRKYSHHRWHFIIKLFFACHKVRWHCLTSFLTFWKSGQSLENRNYSKTKAEANLVEKLKEMNSTLKFHMSTYSACILQLMKKNLLSVLFQK